MQQTVSHCLSRNPTASRAAIWQLYPLLGILFCWKQRAWGAYVHGERLSFGSVVNTRDMGRNVFAGWEMALYATGRMNHAGEGPPAWTALVMVDLTETHPHRGTVPVASAERNVSFVANPPTPCRVGKRPPPAPAENRPVSPAEREFPVLLIHPPKENRAWGAPKPGCCAAKPRFPPLKIRVC